MIFARKPLSFAVALALPALCQTARAGETSTPDSSRPPVMSEVLIRSSKIEAAEPASGKLNAGALDAMRPATSDTASLLKDIPGVSLYGAGGVSSLPVIHGMADDRVRVKVDGMELISACANHMNSPLSYIDPSHVGGVKVFAGIAPVSAGGDSIGGAVLVDSPAPEFAKTGEGALRKAQVGTFYRSNGGAIGGNASATIAGEKLSLSYSGSTAEAGNYKAARNFKAAGLAAPGRGWLAGDEVGSSRYKTENQALGFALRHENHLLDLKLGYQHIPYQGFPNQRMDMTDNRSAQVNLRYTGQYRWGALEARVYNEHTRHKMNFADDKQFWYGTAPGMPMDTEGRNSGALAKADIFLSERDTLRVGGEYQRYRLNDWWIASGTGGMSPNTFQNINEGRRDRFDLFGEWDARWNDRWLTQFGARRGTVRMDAGTVQGYNPGATYLADATAFNNKDRQRTDRNWDMTALVRYTPDASQTFEGGYAQKTRSPNLYERYAWSTGGMAMRMVNFAGDGNGYVGNPDLKPEVAHTLSATADWHDAAQQSWGFKATPYYTYVQDYIDAGRCSSANSNCNAANQTATTGFVYLQFINQNARLYGADISGFFPLLKSSGLGSFKATGLLNYVNGKNLTSGGNLYNIMPLNVKVAVEHRLGGWTTTLEEQLVSAKKDVSRVRDELKTPGYALTNLRGSYEWKQARLDVGVENLFNRFYALPLGGAYTGQGTTMSASGVPYGIAVPGMGRSIYGALNFKF